MLWNRGGMSKKNIATLINGFYKVLPSGIRRRVIWQKYIIISGESPQTSIIIQGVKPEKIIFFIDTDMKTQSKVRGLNL
jgi:hypothetical protein